MINYGYNAGHQRSTFTKAPGIFLGYSYDNLGQLKIADSSANSEDRGYNYDASWNLHYRTNNGAVQTFLVDPRNQLTNAAGDPCTYDANGNLVGADSGHARYDYDAENQLVQYFHCQVNSGYPAEGDVWVRFYYDGLHRLRKRVEYVAVCGGGVFEERPALLDPEQNASPQPQDPGGCTWGWAWTNETRYVYDGMRVIQERDTNNAPTVSYTRGTDLSGSLEGAGGIGGLLARTDGNGSTYYHADGNGNITALVDSSGTLQASYRYDAFGNTLSQSGGLADANAYRFSSKEWMATTGLYYFGYRFYSPSSQRWPNRDPIGEAGGINLYNYVGNNPINGVDSLGLWNYWNPSTWGVGNGVGWSLWDSLNPFHESAGWSGFSLQTTSEADAAFLDGVIPFADPFRNLYDPCDKSLQWSKRIGEYTRDVELALAGARAAKFRGPQYGRWKEAGQWQEGWHGHFDWGNGLGTHHLPQQTGNFLKNLRAVIKRWWNAP